ncbi:MAG: hypothetical protein QM762_25490 [Chryseolinea sp.]
MKRKHTLILVPLLFLLITCSESKKVGFFHSMPSQFKVDSLDVWQKLFASITVKHFDDNIILFQSSDPDLIPFDGILEARDGMIYYRKLSGGNAMPWLKLNANGADTSIINYTEYRTDQVVSRGKFYDSQTRDSVYTFELLPLKRKGSADDIYLKSISMSEGEGIRYLTFGKYMYGNTIIIQNYPRVVGVEGKMPY